MKRITFLATLFAMCLFCSSFAYAADSSTLVSAGVAVASVEETIEGIVINMSKGRAGAAVPTANKGIIFEELYSLKLNCKNIFNNAKTALTKSSTATQVDLVTMDTKSNKVLSRMQLKDTPNSTDHVLDQVKSGKYQQAKMVGTTETAEAYNATAASKGVTKPMTDSGISTKTTSRIADKGLGKLPSYSTLANFAAKAGAIGAGVQGGICLIKSIANGDDVYSAIGNATVGGAKGFASGSVGAIVGELTAVGVAAVGDTGVVAVIVPVVVATIAGDRVEYLTSWVADTINAEDAVAAAAESLVNFAVESGYTIVDTISDVF